MAPMDFPGRHAATRFHAQAELQVCSLGPTWGPPTAAVGTTCLPRDCLIRRRLEKALVDDVRLHRGSHRREASAHPMRVCHPEELPTLGELGERNALQPRAIPMHHPVGLLALGPPCMGILPRRAADDAVLLREVPGVVDEDVVPRPQLPPRVPDPLLRGVMPQHAAGKAPLRGQPPRRRGRGWGWACCAGPGARHVLLCSAMGLLSSLPHMAGAVALASATSVPAATPAAPHHPHGTVAQSHT
mmetsp:Transcript_107742/g.347833  ORF Transcript_107742/g.347833 Transcript_107742/m.347833 type:complete len:244 (-) Transcript_107742:10-741(-)